MALASVDSRASVGLQSPAVRIEVHLSAGLPGLAMVGLPETGVRESKDRVRSAIINSGFTFPQQRITINLAPAELPKEGARFDLAIALGILAASQQLPESALDELCCVGELGLSGDLRAVKGVLSDSLAAAQAGQRLLVPQVNASEARLVSEARVFSASTLSAVVAFLRGQYDAIEHHAAHEIAVSNAAFSHDLSQVKGQFGARRALEIAAAGGHSLLLCGPPGAGKTLLASCLPSILPPLSAERQLQVTALHSLINQPRALSSQPPFRAPHHSATRPALIGGGSGIPRPGEISLAHAGVLFLDELPEFDRHVLESLREPLESGEVWIARAKHQLRYPAQFQLIAAMNPCPCGQKGAKPDTCRCTPEQTARYSGRISGPLLDRLDLSIRVDAVPLTLLQANSADGECSAAVRQRVLAARARQTIRQGEVLNANLPATDLQTHLSANAQAFLQTVGERMALSARAYHRVLRVARTIADLADASEVAETMVAEALTYRQRPN
ncbi:magnesium chelatase family protein [Paraperlucidibaca baekdonensis]|uniref:Magnesium chelatase family protein n=1 Tax=Paraperlucidibaca baekdonensis TaxID=748120 RepID=A0A3E0H8A9_9GAMM|nr:YifB family Mg chelatase-like AAA ATPase [Paraperlucidibaca baekdonensis]REH39968.1 magnesium chelatase family protein [Paraperlucidibaca baekdonensis]